MVRRLAIVLVLASACSIPGDRFFKPGGDGGSDSGFDTPGDELQLGKLHHGYIVDEAPPSQIIHVAKDDTGRISLATSTPTPVNGFALFAVTSKDGRHLYVLEGGNQALLDFQIQQDGSLVQAQTMPLPCKTAFAALHPNGNLLAFACDGGLVALLNLATMQLSSTNAGINPFVPVFTPDGNCLFTTDSNGASSSSVLRFAVNTATGALTNAGSTQGPSPSTAIAVDPAGRFAYVSSSSQPMVQIYQIGAGCGLNVMGMQSIGIPTTSMLIDPPGKRLYVTGMQVFAFDIRTDGTLTPVPNSPFFSGQFTVGAAMDPMQLDSIYLTTNTSTFQAIIELNGALTMGSRVDAGTSNRWFALAPP